jgi:PAS domain S-box-containing protein
MVDLQRPARAAAAPGGSDALFRAAFDHASIGMALVDRAGRCVLVNEALRTLLGYGAAELLERDVASLAHPDDVAASRAAHRSLLGRAAQRVQHEARYVRKDGRVVRLLVTLAVVPDAAGDAPRCLAQMQDVTAQRDAEAALAEELGRRAALTTDNERLYGAERAARAAAEQAAERTEALQAITAGLSEATTPEEIADLIVWQGAAALGASAGGVVVRDGEGAVEVVGGVNVPESEHAEWRHLLSGAVDGPTTRAITAARPIFVEGLEEWARRFTVAPPGSGRRADAAWAVAPLVFQGRVAGAVGFSFAARRALGPEDRVLMMALAEQCAQALERARLWAAKRKALDAAETARARLAGILDGITDAFFACDAEGRVTHANAEHARLLRELGRDAGTALGRTLDDGAPELLVPPFRAALERARRERRPADFEAFFPRLGEWRAVRIFPSADGGVSVFSHDVTDRRRSEEELRRSRTSLAEAQELAQLASWELDLQTGETVCSAALLRLAGLEPRARALPWEEFRELVHRDDWHLVEDALGRATEGGTIDPFDFRVVGADGAERSVHLRASVARDEVGRPRRVVGTWQNVTERKRLEQQFRQAQKMEAVGRLAGGIAHDFNNLLSVIASYSGMVLAELPDDDPSRFDLQEIQRAVDRAAALTRQLLAFSRQQVLQPRVLDLGDVVEGTQRMLKRMIGEDILLVTRTERLPALVKADPGQLEQVLMNLAVNARDAMPSGGTLTIAVDPMVVEGAAAPRLTNGAPGRFVHLRVTDTGHGMDEATQAQIFEPFFTTKKPGQGTGLGLATVYGIVKQSGGFIWVESAPGTGTTFTILLPLATEPAEPPGGEALGGETPRGAGAHPAGATVLLVEDEVALRAVARRLLERQGYNVLAAADGAEALELVERHTGAVHLVVSDVVMPHISGQELVSRLEPRLGDVPVLFMSGYAIEAVERHGVLRPGALFLKKPFAPHEFLLAVADALVARRRAPGHRLDPAADRPAGPARA